jgi:broad specificity phosphatase PhoE
MNSGAQTALPKPVSLTVPGVIFFVRHGQCRSNTEWPIPDYHDGIDPLTDAGRVQARSCGEFLTELLPAVRWRVYSSALRRAVETAEVIAGVTRGEIVAPDPRLNEYSSKSETHSGLLSRLNAFLLDLGAVPAAEGERSLVVTHGHVLECLLCQALSAPIRVVDKGDCGGQAGVAAHANGGVTAFYRGELVLWNAQGHLLAATGSLATADPLLTCSG